MGRPRTTRKTDSVHELAMPPLRALLERIVSASRTLLPVPWPTPAGACRMSDMVQAELERLVQAGRAAWPAVRVDDAAFERFVVERLEPAEMASAHGADLYLAFGCVSQDPKALEAFEREHMARVPAFIHRVDKSEAVAAEVQQVLRERLLVGRQDRAAKIAEYAGRGPLASWLRVVAVRVALELQRSKKPEVSHEDDGANELSASDDPEMDYLRLRYGREFREAFTESLAALDAKQRTILQLYLVDGLNIERIGQVYQVHRATVARWIAGTRDHLYDDTRRRLRDKLHLEVTEFESIVRLVRSQLDVSVRRILQEGLGEEGKREG